MCITATTLRQLPLTKMVKAGEVLFVTVIVVFCFATLYLFKDEAKLKDSALSHLWMV